MAAVAEITPEARFASLVTRLCYPVSEGAIDIPALWNDLTGKYAQPHRHYHSINHILFCLTRFDMCRHLLSDPDLVEVALWYHDVIHFPERKDNEQNSAGHFRTLFSSMLEHSDIDKVCALIIATDHKDRSLHGDTAYLCDIDMSTFAVDWADFHADCMALYREEGRTDPVIYAARKLRFYSFLGRLDRIYLTGFFHERCEALAKENVNRFVGILESSEPATVFSH